MATYPYYTEATHDTGTVPTGSRDTLVSEAEGTLKLDVVDKIFYLNPNLNPFVTLLTSIGKTMDGQAYKGSGIMKAATINPEFSWIEKFPHGRYARVSGTYDTSGGATITLTGAGSQSAYLFTVGDVVINARTKERMEVATVSGATTITVNRSVGDTAAAAGADGDGIYIIGNANAELASARNINTVRSSKETNFT